MSKFKSLDAVHSSSDVSDIAPEELASIAHGVDEMDDALFGFKPKQQDSKVQKFMAEDKAVSDRAKSAVKKQASDFNFPDNDPLADISLSDDDFFDIGKKSPLTKKKETNQPPSTQSQDKPVKTKQIATLFGLNDEENTVTDNKKRQDNAADWLGIKDSPIKKVRTNPNADASTYPSVKKGHIDDVDLKDQLDTTSQLNTKINDQNERQTTNTKLDDKISLNLTATKQVDDLGFSQTRQEKASENLFDLLDDRSSLTKIPQNLKEKRSAVFDELFGNDTITKKTTRRNSAVKVPITEAAEIPGGDELVGQYTPSLGVGRRATTSRRKDPPTTPPTRVSDDWLSNVEGKRQQDTKIISDQVNSSVQLSEGKMHALPTWLSRPDAPPEVEHKQPSHHVKDNFSEANMEKSSPVDKVDSRKSIIKKPADKQGFKTVQEVMSDSAQQAEQTALALQRTEAHLVAALELQKTQSNLNAVCARQSRLLDSQERQLSQLVSRQIDRQTEVETQMTAQQKRIDYLLQALTMNISPSTQDLKFHSDVFPDNPNALETETIQITELKDELHKMALQNEELILKRSLAEKHYKMEFESCHLQHRREIEFWEDQVAKQKEICEQIKEDYKSKIKELKENEAELRVEHNDRVRRLKEESVEDMKQLTLFHKVTLEQVATLGKLVTPFVRDEQKSVAGFRKPLDNHELSEKEEEILKKEQILLALQEKLRAQKELFEKTVEESELKLEQERIRTEDVARKLKQEQSQLKYKQQQIDQETKHLEDQNYVQRKMLEEKLEKVLAEQTQVVSERLALSEEKAKIDALAKLQGVSGTTTFDVLQSKAEVHGALEAARAAKMKAVEEEQKLQQKERALNNYRWKLQEMEEDLASRAKHLDRLMELSQAKEESGKKALEEAKQLEKSAEEKLKELERKTVYLREKEHNLMRMKLNITQEEIKLNRQKEQLQHFLPQLLPEESLQIQPLINMEVIDSKQLIMKLRAEREFETASKMQLQATVSDG